MSNSVAQNLALFQILDCPYVDGSNVPGYTVIDGMGSVGSTVTLSGSTQAQAASLINTWVTNLSSAALTQLQVYLDRWIAMGTKTTRIEGGQVDDIGSVTKDYREEEEKIRSLVKVIVPFYKFHEVLERRAEMGSGMNIGAMR